MILDCLFLSHPAETPYGNEMEGTDTQRLRREHSLLDDREFDRDSRPSPAYDWSTILRVEKLDVLLQGVYVERLTVCVNKNKFRLISSHSETLSASRPGCDGSPNPPEYLEGLNEKLCY
jgi:hypothetical protein